MECVHPFVEKDHELVFHFFSFKNKMLKNIHMLNCIVQLLWYLYTCLILVSYFKIYSINNNIFPSIYFMLFGIFLYL
jgi:hypothetical protein